jgi:hypothetical protein
MFAPCWQAIQLLSLPSPYSQDYAEEMYISEHHADFDGLIFIQNFHKKFIPGLMSLIRLCTLG